MRALNKAARPEADITAEVCDMLAVVERLLVVEDDDDDDVVVELCTRTDRPEMASSGIARFKPDIVDDDADDDDDETLFERWIGFRGRVAVFSVRPLLSVVVIRRARTLDGVCRLAAAVDVVCLNGVPGADAVDVRRCTIGVDVRCCAAVALAMEACWDCGGLPYSRA